MVESQVLRDTCVKCNGEGMVYSVVDILIEVNMLWIACPRCNGTGFIEEEEFK